jgi:hypothetical protein
LLLVGPQQGAEKFRQAAQGVGGKSGGVEKNRQMGGKGKKAREKF